MLFVSCLIMMCFSFSTCFLMPACLLYLLAPLYHYIRVLFNIVSNTFCWLVSSCFFARSLKSLPFKRLTDFCYYTRIVVSPLHNLTYFSSILLLMLLFPGIPTLTSFKIILLYFKLFLREIRKFQTKSVIFILLLRLLHFSKFFYYVNNPFFTSLF